MQPQHPTSETAARLPTSHWACQRRRQSSRQGLCNSLLFFAAATPSAGAGGRRNQREIRAPAPRAATPPRWACKIRCSADFIDKCFPLAGVGKQLRRTGAALQIQHRRSIARQWQSRWASLRLRARSQSALSPLTRQLRPFALQRPAPGVREVTIAHRLPINAGAHRPALHQLPRYTGNMRDLYRAVSFR